MKKVVPFTKTITFRTMIAEITDIEIKHTLELKENHEIEGDILVDGTYKMTDASQIEEEFHYKLPFMIDIDSKYNLDNLEITIGDFYFEIINEEDLKINVEIDIDGIEEKTQEFSKEVTKIPLEEETEILELDEIEESKEVSETEEIENNQELLVRSDSREELKEIPIPVEINESVKKLELQSETMNPLDKLASEIEEDIKEEPNFQKVNKTEQEITKTSTNVSSIFSSLTSSEETFSTYYVYIVRESDTIESIIDKYQTTKEELQNYNDLVDVKVGSKLIIPCATHE